VTIASDIQGRKVVGEDDQRSVEAGAGTRRGICAKPEKQSE